MPQFYYTDRTSSNLDAFVHNAYGTLSEQRHERVRRALIEGNPRGIGSVVNRAGDRVHFTNLYSMLCLPEPANLEADVEACRRIGREATTVGARLGMKEKRTLGRVLEEFGPRGVDVLMTVEQFARRHGQGFLDLASYAAGANYVVTRRLGNFHDALVDYDRALREIGPNKAAFRSNILSADRAFKHLQATFKAEMQFLSRGNRYAGWMYKPYDSFAGGAEASARNPIAPMADLKEMTRLQRVLQATRCVGKGLFVVDIAGRAARVGTSATPGYQFGKEVVSFGTGVVGSWTAYSFILGSMNVLMMSTPYGWIVLIAAVAAGGLAAYLGDLLGRRIYEEVLQHTAPLVKAL